MAASSRRRKKSRRSGILLRGFVASGEMVARNPALAGGATAFLVALCFVSANALWYQPHFYDGAFFATRKAAAGSSIGDILKSAPPTPSMRPAEPPAPPPDTEQTTGAVNRDPTPEAPTSGDPQIWKVQTALADLGLYQGEIDGLSGPNTRGAVEKYQKIVGIEVSGEIDAALLQHLGIGRRSEAAAPPPSPRPVVQVASRSDAAGGMSQADTRKIQAGLKAFGNDGIKVDGVASADMRKALSEFQSLFGLRVTGEANGEVLAKMRDIGLIN